MHDLSIKKVIFAQNINESKLTLIVDTFVGKKVFFCDFGHVFFLKKASQLATESLK